MLPCENSFRIFVVHHIRIYFSVCFSFSLFYFHNLFPSLLNHLQFSNHKGKQNKDNHLAQGLSPKPHNCVLLFIQQKNSFPYIWSYIILWYCPSWWCNTKGICQCITCFIFGTIIITIAYFNTIGSGLESPTFNIITYCHCIDSA